MKTARFTVNLEPADLALLKKVAARAQRKPSDYIRVIIESQIAPERFSSPAAHVESTRNNTHTHAEVAS